MKIINFILVCAVFCVFSSMKSEALWDQVCDYKTGEIRSLAVKGKKLFAGSWDGIFLTTNYGKDWTSASNGIKQPLWIYAIAIKEEFIFAGTDDGLFVSSNEGESWSLVNDMFSHLTTNALVISGDNLFAGTDNGIYLTSDNGINWMNVDTTLNNVRITCLAASGSNIFAGTDKGIFRSTNNGIDWDSANTGFPQVSRIRALAISGTNIFASEINYGKLYISTNNGTNWSAIKVDTTQPFFNVNSFATWDSNILVSAQFGILRSTDYGNTWTKVPRTSPDSKISCFAVSDTNIFAGTYNWGVYLSSDYGETWSHLGIGLKEVEELVIKDSNMFATGFGFYKSSDKGKNWSAIHNELTGEDIGAIEVLDDKLFISTRKEGMLISSDDGASWTLPNNVLQKKPFYFLKRNGANIYVGTTSGLFVSSDDGISWSAINNGITDSIVRCIAFLGANIYVGTYNAGIFLSTDLGLNWTPVNSGLTDNYIKALGVYGDKIFACNGQSGKVYLSANSGASWTYVLTYYPCIKFLNVDSLFFAATELSVCLVDKSGTKWFNITDNQIDIIHVNVMVNDIYASGGELYVVTDFVGIWKRPIAGLGYLSVESESEKLQTIYPNPATDFIEISYPGIDRMVNHTVDHANHTLKGVVDSEITIFNVFGEEVVNLTPALSIHGEGVKLDVSSLSPGVYFVKVGDKTIKFVKY